MTHFSSFGVVLQKDEPQTNQIHPAPQTFVDEDLPAFHRAAAYGDIQTLNQLYKEDTSLLELNSSDGLTPLAQAVQCQQLASVKLLIKLGADINAQDNIGRTCLSVAAYQGWHDGVVCLLHNGARQDVCDKSGRYPLHAATYHSDTNTLCLLLQNLTFKEVNQPDHELMTAVHWAAFHDRPDHLMQLVQKGGDILAKDVDGKLPLHWAAQNGSFQCVHRLTSLTDGLATVNAFDKSQKSPAHYAAASGAANIITILSHCDNINLEVEDPDERTPLHWAAAMGHPRAVETLLKLGVNPFPTDVDGCTPLDYAMQGENEACVKAMESVLGLKSEKLSRSRQNSRRGGKPQVMGPEMKYRYRRGSTPTQVEDTLVPVPHINVLPPTTTENTAPTTVIDMPDGEPDRPRMYSASTDTDAYDFSKPHPPTEVSHQSQAPLKPGGKVLGVGSLISSTYMAGAKGPILTKDTPRNPDRPTSKEARETSGRSRWGHKTNSMLPSSGSRHGDVQELKVMTSTNTPDLNRVSVQSFRSIPPISDRSDALPEHVSRFNDHSTRKKSTATGRVSQRQELKLPPLNPTTVNKQSQFAKMKPILPAPSKETNKNSHQQQPPMHDFMTENVAETRILTRMWQHSSKDVIQHMQPLRRSFIPPLLNNKEVVKSSSNATVLSSRSSKDSAAAALTKHSRIPSTKMLPSNNGDPNSKKTREGDTKERRSHNNTAASTPRGVDDPSDGKYLEDEGCSKPLTPTPLLSIQVSKNGGKARSSNQGHEQSKNAGKSRSRAKDAGTNKSKRNLQRLSNRYGNGALQENQQMNIVEEKIMDLPSLYKGDKKKDGRRLKQDSRKLALAHQFNGLVLNMHR